MEPPPPGAWSNLELERWAVSAVGVYDAHVEDYNAHVQVHNALGKEHNALAREHNALAREHSTMVDRLTSLEQRMSQFGQMFAPPHLALVAGEVWNWAAEQQYLAGETPDPNDTPVVGKFSRINDPQKLYEIQNCAARLRYGNGVCTFDQLVRVADLCIDMRNRRHHFRTAAHLADAVGRARQFYTPILVFRTQFGRFIISKSFVRSLDFRCDKVSGEHLIDSLEPHRSTRLGAGQFNCNVETLPLETAK